MKHGSSPQTALAVKGRYELLLCFFMMSLTWRAPMDPSSNPRLHLWRLSLFSQAACAAGVVSGCMSSEGLRQDTVSRTYALGPAEIDCRRDEIAPRPPIHLRRDQSPMATTLLAVGALAFNVPSPTRPVTPRTRPMTLAMPWETDGVDVKSLVKKHDITIGEGEEAKKGSMIKFDFASRVVDGAELDSAQGVQFELGKVDVLPGWVEGLSGMKPGGMRKVPPSSPRIPPSSEPGRTPGSGM